MAKNVFKEISEWVISIIIAAVIAFAIKGFVIDIIQVSGTSMLSTLHNGDRVVVEKTSLYTHDFHRGEIIIFDPGQFGTGIFIKRIIGLPGDRIEIKDGGVYVNGTRLVENYLMAGTVTDPGNPEYTSLTVPQGSIYVLGDNRKVSEDSRYIGPVPIKNIKGHAILRVFPFKDMKTF